jgi:hypothetical protein
LQATAAEPQIIKTQALVPGSDTIKTNNSTSAPTLTELNSPAQEMQALRQPQGGLVNKSHSRDKLDEFDKIQDKKADAEKQLLSSPSTGSRQAPSTSSGQALETPQGVDLDASTGARNRKLRSGIDNPGAVVTEKTVEKDPLQRKASQPGISKSNDYKK